MVKIRSQNGMSMIGLLAGMVIIMIIGYFVFTKSGALGKKSAKSAKQKVMGAECQTVISSLGMAVQTSISMDKRIESMEQLVSEQPALEQTINNENLWVADGAPTLEYSDNNLFVITGYCVDHKIYTFDSQAGSVMSEPWK